MKGMFRRAGAFALVLMLAACSSTTHLSSRQPATTLVIDGRTLALPSDHEVKGTSFGNYEFKASAAEGGEPFYGLLPLQFKGGRLALDILFFAPAAFANLRGAYPFYEFDVAGRTVRYKRKQGDEWREYRPTQAETERARQRYEAAPPPVAAPATP